MLEKGNGDAESLITMERKGARYLYLRELNKWVLYFSRAGRTLLTKADILPLSVSWAMTAQRKRRLSLITMSVSSKQVSRRFSRRAIEKLKSRS